MSKLTTLILIAVLALSILAMIGCVFAQSIPKPSVPEFTIKIVSAPYDVPATHSIDPFTGEEITNPGYHVENETTQIWIKNQAFSPYQVYENDAEWTIDLFYNIRLKGAFSQDWFYYHYHNGSSDGNLRQAYDSEYTVVLIDSYLPSKGQVDIQIEALVGYEHGIITAGGVPGTPRIITGESSGWSNTQTITIGESQTSSPEPTPTLPNMGPTSPPSQEPALTQEQLVILGLAITVAVLAIGLGLLVYLIKRK